MSSRKTYSTTCFIDKNYKLGGIMYLDDNTYIDFDEEAIYVNNIPQKIRYAYISLLFKLIARSPSIVSYDELFDVYYGLTDSSKDDRQVIGNFKQAVKKYVKIETEYDIGMRIRSLPQKIRRFDHIERSEVVNISELFRTEEQLATERAAKDCSGKFFHSGALTLMTESRDSVLYEMEKLSGVFNAVTEWEYIDPSLSRVKATGSKVVDMYNYITYSCRNTEARDILKIEGPLGSYKNRIMQYIYLMISKSDDDILPFYIDISHYEHMAERDEKITEEDFINAFRSDLDEFRKAAAENSDRIPLLLLDGIRDFSRGNESLYYLIGKDLSDTDCRFVACMDCGFTMNEQHKFKVHPLASDDFSVNAVISSMNLYNKEGSIEFISRCIDIFDAELPDSVSAQEIYDNLVRLNFISVDAYWLVSMLNNCWRDIVSPNSSISTLYKSFCLSIVGNFRALEEAAGLAYEFEYGAVDFGGSNVYFDVRWRLIRNHRSVLDFLIAMHYIKKMSELDFERDSHEESVQKLKFFNMVLQKKITRFVITMLKGDDGYERKIMTIATRFYNDLSMFGKSELTFWMGRLKSGKRKNECVRLLRDFNKQELYEYSTRVYESTDAKRDAAFFLRGINVSLIYEKDEEAFVYYLNSLLTDKTANSVNRGFHLEYYGDKPYIPNKTLLDYEDDITRGANTLTVLCLSLEERMKKGEEDSYVSVLELMTLCNLIQARIEVDVRPQAMDVSSYIDRCVRYLKWMRGQSVLDKIPDVRSYLRWMLDKLSEEEEASVYHSSAVFNKFSKAKGIVRTGWVKDGVPVPENIVEHMYNCWLLGMLHLPDEYSEPGYNKDTILNMLLIHDLGEIETGDISRPEKMLNLEYYEQREREVMQSLLLSGTYPSSADLSRYLSCWNDWDENEDINSLVAKDIDNLQTTYQFCDYCIGNPGLFSDERIRYWLKGIDEMKTEIGERLMDTLVVRNPLFTEVTAKRK